MRFLQHVLHGTLIAASVALAADQASATDVAPRTLERERHELLGTIRRSAAPFPALRRDRHFAAAVAAVGSIPREAFLPAEEAAWSYRNTPVPIGAGQTISAPGVVALMTAAARVDPGARVLEIGTGSGYQSALLSLLGMHVHSIEIVPSLAAEASAKLARLGYRNVEVRQGDGFAGWPEAAPFDAIIVTAGSTRIPPPLVEQLRLGGRLVMPLGPVDLFEQIMVFDKRTDGTLRGCSLGPISFVPLTGAGAAPTERSGELDMTTPYCFGGKRPKPMVR